MSKFPTIIARVILLALICLFGSVAWYFFFPGVGALRKHNPGTTAFMAYRERQWQAEGRHVAIHRQWVSYAHISPAIVRAVVDGEDAKFWQHNGFDLPAIRYAFEKDLSSGKFALGGSTITQQLAKNLYLGPSKNPIRKMREAILTWRIERSISKRRIMELYLNVVEWGDGIFGIEAASQHYFGHAASQLSAHEAALLASVLPNPIKFRPTTATRYVARRSRLIYAIMVRQGYAAADAEDVKAPVPAPVAPAVDSEESGDESGLKVPASKDVDAMLDSLARE
jgi:monofunctional biosynthetic peptidoglycan transglycosylase